MARMSKKQSCRVHATHSALVEYGLVMNHALHGRLIKQIDSKEDCELVCKNSWRLAVYRLRHADRHYFILYDRRRRVIVTFLPPDCCESKLVCL
jgi:hypothetical protein